ncbi:MAG: arsenosugar biosynthesis radical SAM (seleno)protein ArsS [Candidatus Binatia bacterium]
MNRTSTNFEATLAMSGLEPLRRDRVSTVQVNVGKLCNQACHHCHVEAGPGRKERMTPETARRIVELVSASSGVETIDLTGGAPELNAGFRFLVDAMTADGRTVIDRCNLTVLFVPGMDWLAAYLAERRVRLVCSLPCTTEEAVDEQRGDGVFRQSIDALRVLNDLGYGAPDSGLALDLIYNPPGAVLPPPQAELRDRYRVELHARFGIVFNDLLAITNMPIKRFADQLHRRGETEAYMSLLVSHFNPSTVQALMCRTTVSVGWDGSLYDCDFNQMLELSPREAETGTNVRAPLTLDDIASFEALSDRRIVTGEHCFGCTAGTGSSCGGALES